MGVHFRKDEILKPGILIKRGFTMRPGEVYLLSPLFTKKHGWHWIEKWEDAPFRFVAVNPITRQIFTYCEGDLDVTTAMDQATFARQIKEANEFYKKH